MNYTSFLLKKIYKNKLNIIPFILFIGFIIFTYSNNRTIAYRQMMDPNISGKGNIDFMEEKISYLENIVNDENILIKDREVAQKDLEIEIKTLDNTRKRMDAFAKENWKDYYKSDLALSEAKLDRYKIENASYLDESIKVSSIYLLYDQHMLDYGDGYDHPFVNIQGISFMNTIYKFYIPFILCIIMIYVTSRVYCSTNIDKMDIQNILSISPFKRQLSRLCVGTCVGLSVIIFFSLLAVLCGTMGNVLGNLHSPIIVYTLEGRDHVCSFIEIVPQLLILMVLAVGFVSNIILCTSLIFRKSMTCMLLSLVIILGGLFVLPQLIPISGYIHLIPTTYINFFNVLTGEVAYNTHNIGVNFTNGAIVLIISNVVLMIMYYLVTRIRIKNV